MGTNQFFRMRVHENFDSPSFENVIVDDLHNSDDASYLSELDQTEQNRSSLLVSASTPADDWTAFFEDWLHERVGQALTWV